MRALLLGSPAQPQKVWIIKSVQVQEGEKYSPTLRRGRCQDLCMRRAQSLGRSSSPGFTHQPAPFPAGPRAGEALPNHAITTGPRQPGPGAGVRRAGAAAGPQGAHGEGGREAPPPRPASRSRSVPTAKRTWKLIATVLCL